MKSKNNIASFTILEVMIVLIITGIVSTLIFGSFQRTNEQLRQSELISDELNDWITIRSNLFSELYYCDSINVSKQKAEIYLKDRTVSYTNKSGEFWRAENNQELLIDASINSITSEEINGTPNVLFEFEQKNTPVVLSFPLRKGISHDINSFFRQLK